jgi:hypothetical protein
MGPSFKGNDDTLSYNTIAQAEMAGAEIDGQNSRIVGNDVNRSVQYPANCPARNGADADGFRFFGSGHDFQQNYIHDIDYHPTPNPGPPHRLLPDFAAGEQYRRAEPLSVRIQYYSHAGRDRDDRDHQRLGE